MRERLGLLLKQRRLSQDDVKAVLQVQLYTFLFRQSSFDQFVFCDSSSDMSKD